MRFDQTDGTQPGRGLTGPVGLDPDVAELLDRLNAIAPTAGADTTAAGMRAGFGALLDLLHPEPAPAFDGTITDDVVGGGGVEVPVRIYRPRGSAQSDRVLVFAHGGGWVLGNLDSADPHVRRMAARLPVVVVSVDYRTAPEHRCPAAVLDCIAVHDWVVRTWAPAWVGVAGDSAGGNLAAGMALDATRHRRQCDAQLLFYPALDPAMTGASHDTFATGYLLDRETMAFYWRSYLGPSPALDEPYAAPMQASDAELAGVAPAVITTAGFDPLRDEGVAYAERLDALGVPVTYLPQPGLTHGWLDQIDVVPAAADACDAVLDSLETQPAGARTTQTKTTTLHPCNK